MSSWNQGHVPLGIIINPKSDRVKNVKCCLIFLFKLFIIIVLSKEINDKRTKTFYSSKILIDALILTLFLSSCSDKDHASKKGKW